MRIRFLRACAAAFVTAAFLGACASAIRIPASSPGLWLNAQLLRPEGDGRFPAVVLLAPCGGVTSHMSDWARWLKAQGHIALIVDSLSSRGVASACEGGRGPGEFQVGRDAVDALVYLRTLPFVDRDRVAAMGWSLGGSAALEASSTRRASWPGYADTPPFQAVVAFYPSCWSLDRQTSTPTLLLLAGRDDWTPPDPCLATTSQRVRKELYPEALHAFDRPDATPYLGHAMAYDRDAAAASHEAVRTFLVEQVQGKRP